MRPAGPNDVFRATPRTYAPRYGRFSGRAPWWSTYYGAGGYYAPYETATPVEEVDPPQGRLALTVTPSSTQIFADGFFMGTVADFQDRGLWLPVGPRRIELRAEGYDTVTFDVRINEDRPVEYQRNLTGVSPRSEAPRVAAVPKTFYVIPGCYAGDTPPRMNRLPSGCSTNNVRTVPPVLSRLSLSNK
jgi:hypothetical protein